MNPGFETSQGRTMIRKKPLDFNTEEKDVNNKKVILFGAGQLGQSIADFVPDDVEVLAFTDNDTMKTGRLIKGFRVIEPGSILDHDFDFVVITTSAVAEVGRQLSAMGIPNEKILMPENGEPSGRWLNQQVEYDRFYSQSDDPSNIDPAGGDW